MISEKFEEFTEKHIDFNQLTRQEAERYEKDFKRVIQDMKDQEKSMDRTRRSLYRSCIYFIVLLVGGIIGCITPKEWMVDAWVSLIAAAVFLVLTGIEIGKRKQEDKFNKRKSLK